ncbi:MAG: ribosome silencing factor [Proteobacteria bacterium]|nr:ribosome silencing factor [Pseudomonadota bacterium]
MQAEELRDLAVNALEDVKGVDVVVIDVRGKTAITDFMIVATGTSDRHVKALADNTLKEAREAGIKPLGVEGEQSREWILLDMNDVVVHVMLREVRDFYGLEKLWSVDTE